MKKTVLIFGAVIIALTLINCHDVNCLPDSHFSEDGNLIEPIDSALEMMNPYQVKFFMEASGSMNGLYRPGCKTEFRDDVYQIISYYLSDNDEVYTLCSNNGRSGYSYSLTQFGSAIKSSGFPAMDATSITDMMETVISNIDTLNHQVGVLISDMKFDPDGIDNIEYQLGMYTTKVSHITSESNLSFSLVAAKSKYFNKQNSIISEESPYYYLIMGKSENVAKVRDDISTMLMKNGNYVDNIETGMNYGGINFELEKVRNCMKQPNAPTFVDVDPSEPCKIKLNIHLENYRWRLANEDFVRSSFTCKMIHGSSVDIDSIDIDSTFINSTHELDRKVIASIYMSVKNLQADCDVIEWTFNPCSQDNNIAGFANFCGAMSWQDFSKTYSIEYFLKGFFRAAKLSQCSKKSNYILISTHQ